MWERHFELQEAIWRLYRPLGWTMVKIERRRPNPRRSPSASEETLDARLVATREIPFRPARVFTRSTPRTMYRCAWRAFRRPARRARRSRCFRDAPNSSKNISRPSTTCWARDSSRHAGLARPGRFGARTRQSAQGPCRRLRAISTRSLRLSGADDAVRLPESPGSRWPTQWAARFCRTRPWRRRPFRAAVVTAPMIDIHGLRFPRGARLLANTLDMLGLGAMFIPGRPRGLAGRAEIRRQHTHLGPGAARPQRGGAGQCAAAGNRRPHHRLDERRLPPDAPLRGEPNYARHWTVPTLLTRLGPRPRSCRRRGRAFRRKASI